MPCMLAKKHKIITKSPISAKPGTKYVNIPIRSISRLKSNTQNDLGSCFPAGRGRIFWVCFLRVLFGGIIQFIHLIQFSVSQKRHKKMSLKGTGDIQSNFGSV